MARDDDDDDSLPPLGENTERFLDQAKKGQPRNFLLVCKGSKVKYLAVKKKPVKKNDLNEAKKLGYKGEGYFGVITGKGMELVFNLSTADGYTVEPVKDKILKDFLEEKADFKCKPTIAIVATLPAVPFDDEDLKHPLVARFLALDVPITEVLDMNPNAESELGRTTSEIRLLLQDADFDTAEPRIGALESRLQALLKGAAAESSAPASPASPTENSPPQSSTSQPTPSASPTATPPTQPVDNDVLKQKLQEALNKLVPQLKQAVVTYPDKKVELLTPVALIKKQMESGDLQEAKKGILAVGQLLKSVMSQGNDKSQNENTSENLKAQYDQKLATVRPLFDKALKERLGDTDKFRAVMGYLEEQAAAGVFENAIKAIDRLLIAIQTAINANSTSNAQAQAPVPSVDVENADADVEPNDETEPIVSMPKLSKARIELAPLQDAAIKQINVVKDAVREEFADDEDQADELVAALSQLDQMIIDFRIKLVDELDKVLNAEVSQRGQLLPAARKVISQFQTFVENHPIASVFDGNEFVPETFVIEPLQDKLDEILRLLS